MRRRVQVTQRDRIETARQQIGQAIIVARGLRHLQPIDQQVLAVNPVLDEGFAGIAFALRDLVFVMRKDQIDAARVNVDLLAQVLERHGAAFDVPAGEAIAPRAGPLHHAARLGRLPQREVFRGEFIGRHFTAHTAQ